MYNKIHSKNLLKIPTNTLPSKSLILKTVKQQYGPVDIQGLEDRHFYGKGETAPI